MKINTTPLSSCLLMLLSMLCLSQFAVAQSDTMTITRQAESLLLEATAKTDFAAYQEALALAQAAEQTLLQIFDAQNPQLAEVYCAIGLAHMRLNSSESEVYLQKVLGLALSNQNKAKADVHYFQGMWALQQERNFVEAAAHFHDALIQIQRTGGMPVLLGSIHAGLGYAFLYQGRYAESITENQQAIQVWSDAYGLYYPRLAHPYNNIGLAYHHEGHFRQSLTYLKQAFEVRERVLPPNHLELAASLLNIGLVYNSFGDFDYAVEYMYQALGIVQQVGREDYLAAIYTNLGMTHSGKKEYAKAREYYELTLQIEQTLYDNPADPEIVLTLFNIAIACKDQGHYEAALQYFQLALEGASPDHLNLCSIYNGLGITQLKMQRYADAEDSFKQSLEAALSTYGNQHPTVALAYLSLARMAINNGQIPEAMDLNQRALDAVGYKGGNSLDGVSSALFLVKIMSQRCNFLWVQVQGAQSSNSTMTELLVTCRTLLDIFDRVSRSYQRSSSRQELIEEAYPVFELAIAAHLRRYHQTGSAQDFDAALGYAERSKGVLLHEALIDAEAQQIAGIPSDLIQQEYVLRDSLAQYETQRQRMISMGKRIEDKDVLDINLKIRHIDNRYAALMSIFQREFPRYFYAKHERIPLSLETIQREVLLPNQSLIEYVVGDSLIYIFLVQPDFFDAVIVPKEDTDALVQQMTQDGLYGSYAKDKFQKSFREESQTLHNFTDAAFKLYDILWRPIRENLGETVIVIPDGSLGYIPFEVLLSAAPPRQGIFRDYAFLIRDYCISYAYSATLLQEMRKASQLPATRQLLALAPFSRESDLEWMVEYTDDLPLRASFLQRDSLRVLPASRLEADGAVSIWGGEVYHGAAASIEQFRAVASQYRILHLATHGQADDRLGDYAYLAFGIPGQAETYAKFYANQFYSLDLNAELVFLSACETGKGRLRKGEGIISMARAFAYAGTQSIVSSLWPVNDKSASDIPLAFYTYLKEGKSKAEALRQAKLDFFNKNTGKNHLDHPYFWGALVGIGNMQ